MIVCKYKLFSYLSFKTYVESTQKNRLSSFEYIQHMLKLIDDKIFASIHSKTVLIWTYHRPKTVSPW